MSTDDSGHSSRPSQASRPDGCRVASPHSAAFHLPASLIAASPFEFACPHRLWHGRCWALQNECDGGRDALVRMPTPPQHVDEDFSSIGVKVMWWRDEQSKI